MELSILINKFAIKGRLVALQPFGNGNINDTFLAIYRNTFTETQVILPVSYTHLTLPTI